jgi:hypothetical protein
MPTWAARSPSGPSRTRSLSHTSYHCGQIVQTARVLASRAGLQWKTLTAPRGGSAAFNKAKGFDPSQPT